MKKGRIQPLDPQTEGPAGEIMSLMQKQMGAVPNLYRAMANSPAALNGFLSLRTALQSGRLDRTMQERIALLVASENDCDYCKAAHTMLGRRAGLDDAELESALAAESNDDKIRKSLIFAREVLRNRGQVSDSVLEQVRGASWSDEEIIEIVAHIVLNIFSNYIDHVAHPQIDFPPPIFKS